MFRSLSTQFTNRFFCSQIAGSPKPVRKYLGCSLLSQAGVPLALAVLVAKKLESLGGDVVDASVTIIETVTATTLVVQLITPLLVKWALKQADELDEISPVQNAHNDIHTLV